MLAEQTPTHTSILAPVVSPGVSVGCPLGCPLGCTPWGSSGCPRGTLWRYPGGSPRVPPGGSPGWSLQDPQPHFPTVSQSGAHHNPPNNLVSTKLEFFKDMFIDCYQVRLKPESTMGDENPPSVVRSSKGWNLTGFLELNVPSFLVVTI